MRDESPGADVDRLRLLASAIAGRALEVAVAAEGDGSWTDGTTVFVDAAAPPADQLCMVGVQASLLAAGSLEPALVRQLARRPGLARRYVAVEGHRALAANEPVLPAAVRALVGRGPDAGEGTAEASLAVARSRRPLDDPPAAFGTIRPRRLLAAAEAAEPGPGPDAGGADHAHRTPAKAPLEEFDDDADDTGADELGRDLGNLLSSPVGGGGPVGRLLQRMLSSTRGPGGGGAPGADAPTHTGRARARGRGTATSVSGAPGALDTVAAFEPGARCYPEWNTYRQQYRPDWCVVHEPDPRPAGPTVPAPGALPDGVALRRVLARLGTGLDRTRRRPQGDDIDIDAAVEARVAALAGSPADGAAYIESLRRRRDLAVLVLLDISGSAAEPGPAGRTVHEHQRAAASALTTALHDLGDRVALYAFNSQGRRAVHVTRVKGFDDRLDSQAARRLAALVPGAYTRLGAAIRHGASVLERRGGTSRRLLLVLSDGFAYDHGYEGAYGEADARRALTEARRRGLGCLCISVGAATPPVTLQRVFGAAAHGAVPTADRLPDVIGPLVRAALRSAEAQRRTFQRRERTREQAQLERRAP